jgi:hypothetical protein
MINWESVLQSMHSWKNGVANGLESQYSLCRDALVHLVDPQARPGIEAALFTKHSRHDCCSRLAVQGTNKSSRRRCTNATDIIFHVKLARSTAAEEEHYLQNMQDQPSSCTHTTPCSARGALSRQQARQLHGSRILSEAGQAADSS